MEKLKEQHARELEALKASHEAEMRQIKRRFEADEARLRSRQADELRRSQQREAVKSERGWPGSIQINFWYFQVALRGHFLFVNYFSRHQFWKTFTVSSLR